MKITEKQLKKLVKEILLESRDDEDFSYKDHYPPARETSKPTKKPLDKQSDYYRNHQDAYSNPGHAYDWNDENLEEISDKRKRELGDEADLEFPTHRKGTNRELDDQAALELQGRAHAGGYEPDWDGPANIPAYKNQEQYNYIVQKRELLKRALEHLSEYGWVDLPYSASNSEILNYLIDKKGMKYKESRGKSGYIYRVFNR